MTNPPGSSSPSPMFGSQKHVQVVGYAEYVEQQLGKVRRQVQAGELLSATIGWAALVLSILLIFVVWDHWIGDVGTWGRLAILIAWFAFAGWLFVRRIAAPLRRRVNAAYAAKVVEDTEPQLKNGLINLVFLRHRTGQASEVILREMEQQTATQLSSIPIDAAVDRSGLIRWFAGMAGLIVLFTAYAVFSPKSTFDSIRRLTTPWSAIPRPSRVQIRDVEPGNTSLYYGRSLLVRARVANLADEEPVVVLYSTADRQAVQQRVVMQLQSASGAYEAVLPAGREGATSHITYQVAAGDAVTVPYHAEVLELPSAVVDRIRYEFPPYTGRESSEVEHVGDIEAIEGTRVTWSIRTNDVIDQAFLEFDPVDDEETPLDRRWPLVAEGQSATGTYTLTLEPDRQTPTHRSYQVRFHNEAGALNPAPVVHRIDVLRDLAPVIEILRPITRDVQVPEDGALEVEIRALDPDFAIEQVRLLGVSRGEQVLEAELLTESTAGQMVLRHSVRPREINLVAGDSLIVWAEARDTRHDPVSREPAPNIERTTQYRVTVVSPTGNGKDKTANQSDEQGPSDQQGQQGPSEPPDESDASAESDEQGPSGQQGQQDQSEQQGPSDESDASAESDEQGPSGQQDQQDQSEQQGQPDQPDESAASAETNEQAPSGQQDQQNQSEQGGQLAQQGNSDPTDRSDPSDQQGQQGEQGSQGQQGQQGQEGQQGQKGQSDTSGQQDKSGHQGPEDGASEGASKGQDPLPSDGSRDGEAFERILEQIRQQQQAGDEQRERSQSSQDGESGEQTPGNESDQQSEGNESAQRGEPRESDQPTDGSESDQRTEQEDSRRRAEEGPSGRPKGGKDSDQARGDSRSVEPMPDGESAERTEHRQSRQPTDDRESSEQESDHESGPPSDDDKSGPPEEHGESDQPKEGNPSDQPTDGSEPDQTKEPRESGQQESGGKSDPPNEGSESGQSGERQESGQPGSGNESGQPAHGSESGQPMPGKESAAGEGEAGNELGTPGENNASGQPMSGSESSQATDGSEAGQPMPGSDSPTSGERLSGTNASGRSDRTDGDRGEREDQANLDYARQATELVLDYLEDQKGNPDPELLDQLGWSQEDLQRFLARWQQMRKEAGTANESNKKGEHELDELLRGLGLVPPRQDRLDARRRENQRIPSVQEDGGRSEPPAPYRERYRAYLKSRQSGSDAPNK